MTMTDKEIKASATLNERGELVWQTIYRYYGDFKAFWQRKSFEDKTGCESQRPSMVLNPPKAHAPWRHPGD